MLQVPEIFSPLPHPPPVVSVEESSGRPLFTFSSETASLIKFLSVAAVVPSSCRNRAALNLTSAEKLEGKIQPSTCGSNSVSHAEISDSQRKPKFCDSLQSDFGHKSATVDKESVSDTEPCKTSPLEMHNSNSPSHNAKVSTHCRSNKDDSKVENSDDSDSNSTIQPKKIKVDCSDDSVSNLHGKHLESPECCFDTPNENIAINFSESNININNNQRTIIDSISCNDCIQMRESSEVSKNLIFVTGEFAVALHQLGFKNVPSINESSSRGRTLSDSSAGDDGYMVVNYSNNDIHIVQRKDRADKPDNLIDLFGHVTGLCLSEDQR